MRTPAAVAVFILLFAGPLGAEDTLPPEMAALAAELDLARQGELLESGPLWLKPWELPHEIQREFTPPSFSMKVLDAPEPYITAAGRRLHAGDEIGGYLILLIEPDGVVLDVDGYAVVID